MLLCMLGKIYYKYVGGHSQIQGHLGESRVAMTLRHMRGWEEIVKREENRVHEQEGQKVQKEWLTTMVRLYSKNLGCSLG